MNTNFTEYGVFGDLISALGALIATVTALRLSFKGRASWEPSEEDVPQGAQKLAGLITAVAIASLWFWFRSPQRSEAVTTFSIYALFACLISLLFYALVTNVLTYEQVYAVSAKKTGVRKIIGGFWLKSAARKLVSKHTITVQELLASSAYDPDKVWPRMSRGLAQIIFIFCYISLVSSGTIALCCAAILVSNATFSSH